MSTITELAPPQPDHIEPLGQQGDPLAEYHNHVQTGSEELLRWDPVSAAERILYGPSPNDDGSQSGNGGPNVPQVGSPNSNSNINTSTPHDEVPSDSKAELAEPETPEAAAANEAVREALADQKTEYYVFGAYVGPGVGPVRQSTGAGDVKHPYQRFAPNKSQMAATIVADGARLDLQHSSLLSEVENDGRSRTRGPILLTMRGEDDALHFFAYDNQTLIAFPDNWVSLLQEDFKQTGGSAESAGHHQLAELNIDFGRQLMAKREERVRQRASQIVTDDFVRTSVWSSADSGLPTELVIGDIWGGNSGAAGLRLEAATVGQDVLRAAGMSSESLAGYSKMNFETTASPLTHAAAMLQRVEALGNGKTDPN